MVVLMVVVNATRDMPMIEEGHRHGFRLRDQGWLEKCRPIFANFECY